jgi:hypothetical protein
MPVWDNQPGKGKKEVFLRRGKKRPSLIDSMVDLLESKRKSPLSYWIQAWISSFRMGLTYGTTDSEPFVYLRSYTEWPLSSNRSVKDVFEDHLVWLVTISSSLYSRASKTRYPIEVNVHKDREVVAVNLSTRVVLGRRCLLFFNMEFKSDPRV